MFAKDSMNEIQIALNTPHHRLGNNYNPQKDFVYKHIRTMVSDWVRLLEMQPNPLTLDMPEAWYCINVWRTIDIAFSDMPHTYVVGTLPNVGPIQQKVIGKRGDAYVRTIGLISNDWAASEAESGLSLPRTLKDTFTHLADKIKFTEEKLRKLNVVGFIHTGAVLIRTNLDCPDGYICQYTRRNPLEVYVDVNNFGKSLDVLVEIIYAKLLVLQTMKVVNDSVDGKSNVTRWKKQAKLDRSNITTIPDVHPSPKR
nr:5391_t:CDS:2 [Entrophospora candida]